MASPIQDCGNFVATSQSGPSAHPVYRGYWTSGGFWGTVIRNLTTRDVSCRDARSAALQIMEVNRTYPWHGFRLRFTSIGGNGYDVRGVRGGKVVHWQYFDGGVGAGE